MEIDVICMHVRVRGVCMHVWMPACSDQDIVMRQ